MSRRYRLEQERSKIEEHEVEVEEDKIKLQRERIFAPVIWQRFGTGYRIEDLKEARYDETLNMIRVCNCDSNIQSVPIGCVDLLIIDCTR